MIRQILSDAVALRATLRRTKRRNQYFNGGVRICVLDVPLAAKELQPAKYVEAHDRHGRVVDMRRRPV